MIVMSDEAVPPTDGDAEPQTTPNRETRISCQRLDAVVVVEETQEGTRGRSRRETKIVKAPPSRRPSMEAHARRHSVNMEHPGDKKIMERWQWAIASVMDQRAEVSRSSRDFPLPTRIVTAAELKGGAGALNHCQQAGG